MTHEIVLMSIHSKYGQSILNGEKLIEFRKTKLHLNAKHILIYETSPVKMITGVFIIKEQIIENPIKLWNAYGDVGSISKEDFLNYYKNNTKAVGIRISKAEKFKTPLLLQDFSIIRPPQSFLYLKDVALNKALTLLKDLKL